MSETDSGKIGDRQGAPAETGGRYLYCLVDCGGVNRADTSFSVEGIDDQPVYLIEREGIGVVVHQSDTLYDSEDLDEVRRWLLDHQRVIDAAGERYGTPLPFRFDTILTGDDSAVETWVADHESEISEALSSFAGTWEYRIHLAWDPETLRELLLETDEELGDLAPDADTSDGGTEFLEEKRFQQHLRSAQGERKEAVAGALGDELAEFAYEVEPVERPRISEHGDDGPEPFAGFSILASEGMVEAIGNHLDDVAETPGLQVTFTGPWPPYTFAPTIGEDS